MTQAAHCLLVEIMEVANGGGDEEPDPPLLTDSGTESFNDSPTADESPNSAASACHWELNSQPRIHINLKSLLDKSISIDEDILVHPLEPEVLSLRSMSANGSHDDPRLISILRRTSYYDTLGADDLLQPKHLRRVSFPENPHALASYRNSTMRSPILPEEPWDGEHIVAEYQSACTRHKTIQLDPIKNQLMAFKNNIDYSGNFSLATLNVTMEVCETLEDVLKVTNFNVITIRDCTFTPESVREFINMLDYYNCTTEIITTDCFTQESEVWSSFCSMVAKCYRLRALSFESFAFAEHQFRALLNGVKHHTNISVLKFNGCKLSNIPTTHLVNALEMNMVLQELYLPQTGLYTREAELLSRLLTNNHTIRVLDISNNQIGDRGLEVLARGLCTHTDPHNGLSVLVIYNTQISDKSALALSNIISGCKSLHTLNIGCNNLTDEVISKISDSLTQAEYLEGLGLQTTLLTDRGAFLLGDAVLHNHSLQKINLKGNKGIQIPGLEHLCKALTNTKIIKLEIDETNRNCDDAEGYLAMVAQITAICTVNKTRLETPTNGEEKEITRLTTDILRKVSLNCEPYYNLQSPPEAVAVGTKPTTTTSRKKSPMHSPGCSPTTRHRFSVSPVPEAKTPKTRSSRFTVSPVNLPPDGIARASTPADFGSGETLANSPPPDDDVVIGGGQFSNLRSSVSSIESVDSFSTKDSVYDSATPSVESD